MKFPNLKNLPLARRQAEGPTEKDLTDAALVEAAAPAPSICPATRNSYGRFLQTHYRTKLDPEERELYVSEMMMYLSTMDAAQLVETLTADAWPQILDRGIRAGILTDLTRDF